MDVQDAIRVAKAFVGVAFSGEDVTQVRTGEFEFDASRSDRDAARQRRLAATAQGSTAVYVRDEQRFRSRNDG